MGQGWEEAQEGRDMFYIYKHTHIYIYDSLCCTAQIDTTL